VVRVNLALVVVGVGAGVADLASVSWRLALLVVSVGCVGVGLLRDSDERKRVRRGPTA
jgi:hypothetical protein